MKEQSCLTFSLSNSDASPAISQDYSISTEYLEEIFPLPEVTLLSTASPDIIGVINLRGDIIPILNPKVSLGLEDTSAYQLTDSIMVLQQSQLRVGLIVNGLGAIETLSEEDIQTSDAELEKQRTQAKRKGMIAGKVQPQRAVTEITNNLSPSAHKWLLNPPEQWLQYVDLQPLIAVRSMIEDSALETLGDNTLTGESAFCPEAPPATQRAFQERARSLQQPIAKEQEVDLTTLAIVSIADAAAIENNETYLGVDLLAVKEFAALGKVTPVPCCPPHIIGNMNLRGEILTLIDLQHLAGQSPHSHTAESPAAKVVQLPLKTAKAMVIEVEGIVVGVLINHVVEAMFPLPKQDFVGNYDPAATAAAAYLQGQFSYRGETVKVLNLPQILLQGGLIVDEVV